MSFPSILYILGWIMTFFGGALMVPASVSYIYKDTDFAAFMDTGTGAIFIGVLLTLVNRRVTPSLNHRDGFLLTFLVWATLSVVGAFPFYIAGVTENFVDAFFESVSGLTTTGASVLTNLDTTAHGILIWRSMLQWLGGMGIVVLAVAVLPFLGIGGLQLYKNEMPGVTADKLQPRLKETAKLLWLVYLILTLTCTVAYWLAGMSAFDAINHAFTTVATGGYSTHDASLAYFESPLIEMVAIVFMLIGAVNFSLHYLFMSGHGLKLYFKDVELRVFLIILVLSIIAIVLMLSASNYYDDISSVIRYTVFNTIAVVTTTGYATADYNQWPVLVPIVVLTLMFFGGCTGSTAGGMKVLRIIMIVKQGGREVFKLLHPRAITNVKIGKKTVSPDIMQAVWSFAGLYIICFIAIAMAISAFGIDLITAFSAAAATLTGLGPGLGEVGPASNYAHLPLTVKLILCFSMLLGRLELFTILIIFTPQFWRK